MCRLTQQPSQLLRERETTHGLQGQFHNLLATRAPALRSSHANVTVAAVSLARPPACVTI